MTAYIDILWIDFASKQPCRAVTCWQQTSQNLHRRGFAAAIRAKKSENLAARNTETYIVNGSEVAKSHRDMLGFNSDAGICLRIARRHNHFAVALSQFFRQKRNE